jgi:hypothetical protein
MQKHLAQQGCGVRSLTPDALSDARRDQMFPVLETSEIGRITRLGVRRSYAEGVRILPPAKPQQAPLSCSPAGRI